MKAYRLQLDQNWTTGRYIITGDEWFTVDLGHPSIRRDKPKFTESSGLAIIYPEHDLLWIGLHTGKTERFKTLENFEKEFIALPRWEATRYAVVEAVTNISAVCDADGNYGPQILHYGLFLFDCRTGQRIKKPLAGQAAEVARLRRGIEPMMRGESFSFM